MPIRKLSCICAWRQPDPKAIKPQQFLDWAKADLKGGDARCLANALTNAKRAVHAYIDRILLGFRVARAQDWPASPDADTKLKALKLAGAPRLNIARSLTKRRNELEHSYLLVSKDQLRADVEAASMWLDKIRKWEQPSVLVGGLDFGSIGTLHTSKPGRPKCELTGEFRSATTISHFWDSKRQLRKVDSSGIESITPYSALAWKFLVREQTRLWTDRSNQNVTAEMATRLVRFYIRWRRGGPSAFTIRSRRN